jgi:integrase
MTDNISRRCLHVHEWPEIDQDLWHKVTAQGSVLDETLSKSSLWRAPTRNRVRKGYGRWLSFLISTDRMNHDIEPADRAHRDAVYAYVTCLQGQVQPWTVWSYTLSLWQALRSFAPDEDWEWLYVLLAKLQLFRKPSRDKRARMQSPTVIANWSFNQLDKLNKGWLSDTQGALTYRNTLMVTLLVHCPIRLRNLVMIRIGKHLIKVEDRYQLDFEPSEVKTDRYLTHFLPAELTPYVDIWLEAWRPLLLKDPVIDAFWVGIKGKPMRSRGVYGCVVATTEDAFGTSINPHLFRDIAASWIVDMTPENIGIASSLLGHINPATTEDHYIQANQSIAGARYRSSVDELRNQFNDEYGDPYQDRSVL